MNNTGKKSPELNEKEKLKKYFPDYLDEINEKYLGNEMSNKVKLKNINLYNTALEFGGIINLLKHSKNIYELYRILPGEWGLERFIENNDNKKNLIIGNYLIFVNFGINEKSGKTKVEEIVIIKNKTPLFDFIQLVKGKIGDFLPKPKPVNS